jgi:hypothetical protein
MNRALYLAALGITLTIVLLPATRWVAENHWDTIFHGAGHFDSMAAPVPENLIELDKVQWTGEDADLVASYFATDRKSALAASLRYGASHPEEPIALANTLRIEIRDTPLPYQKQKMPLSEIIPMAERGRVLEPDNAFFPFVEALACAVNGRPAAEIEQYLAVAANDKSHNDYSHVVQTKAVQAFLDRFGYRGEVCLQDVMGLAVKPFQSGIHALESFVLHLPFDHQGLEARLHLMMVADTLLDNASNVMDLTDGVWMTQKSLIRPSDESNMQFRTSREERFATCRIRSLEMDSMFAQSKIVASTLPSEYWRRSEKWERACETFFQGLGGDAFDQNELGTAIVLGPWMKTMPRDIQKMAADLLSPWLCVIPLVLLLAGASYSVLRRWIPDALASVFPLVPATAATFVLMPTFFKMSPAPIGMIAPILMAIGVWLSLRKHDRASRWALVVLCILGALYLLIDPLMLAAVAIGAIAMGASGRRRWLVLTAWVVFIGCEHLLMQSGELMYLGPWAIAFMFLLPLLAIAATPNYAKWKMRDWLAWNTFALAICYLVVVITCVRFNEALRPATQAFANEAATVREIAIQTPLP